MRASEPVRGVVGADVVDLSHLEIKNAYANECRDKRSNHLGCESLPRRDLGIMGKLKIVRKPYGMSASDITEALEEVHR